MSTALLVMWMWMHGQAQTVNPCQNPKLSYFSHQGAVEIDGGCPVYSEPMDVPAVQETKQFNICGDMSELDWHHYEQRPIRSGAENLSCVVVATYDTCADKSRVLLTSEDGKRWCHKVELPMTTIKFPSEPCKVGQIMVLKDSMSGELKCEYPPKVQP